MIPTHATVIRHRNGTFLRARPGGFELVSNWRDAARWTRDNAEKLILLLPTFGVNPNHLRPIDAPSCECCGAYRPDDLVEVYGDARGEVYLRCRRHLDRLPCCIEGCARTFAIRPALGESYRMVTMCARHWKMAPKCLRDLHARCRRDLRRKRMDPAKRARREGQATRFWYRCATAVQQKADAGGDGHIDVDEIAAMFGFSEDDE